MVERLKVGDRVWALHPALAPSRQALGGERGFAPQPCSRTRITGREPRSAARAMTTLSGSNPRSKGDEVHEAAQEQPCGGQEHQDERHLAGGQHRLSDVRAPAPEAAGRRRACIVEGPDQVGARPGARWGGAEEETCSDRQGGRGGEDGSVDTDMVESGHASRNHRGCGAHDPGGHGEAQRTADEAEDDALGEQLPDNPVAPLRRGRRGWQTSRRRAVLRASSRPATLAQAISSTRSVAAASIRSAGRKGRPRSSRNTMSFRNLRVGGAHRGTRPFGPPFDSAGDIGAERARTVAGRSASRRVHRRSRTRRSRGRHRNRGR